MCACVCDAVRVRTRDAPGSQEVVYIVTDADLQNARGTLESVRSVVVQYCNERGYQVGSRRECRKDTSKVQPYVCCDSFCLQVRVRFSCKLSGLSDKKRDLAAQLSGAVLPMSCAVACT